MPAPPDFPGQDRSLRWLIHPAPPCSLVDQLSELLQRPCGMLQPPFGIRCARGTEQVPGPDGPGPAAQPLQALLLLIQLSQRQPSAALPASTRPSRDHPGHSEKNARR